MNLRKRRLQLEDETKALEFGVKKTRLFMTSSKGIGILVGVATLIFFICVFLYNLFGQKAVIYFACFVFSAFFFGRDLIGGEKYKPKDRPF